MAAQPKWTGTIGEEKQRERERTLGTRKQKTGRICVSSGLGKSLNTFYLFFCSRNILQVIKQHCCISVKILKDLQNIKKESGIKMNFKICFVVQHEIFRFVFSLVEYLSYDICFLGIPGLISCGFLFSDII